MATHTIDVRATLTLHVEAGSADEALSKVLGYGSENPDLTIAEGVVVHELTLHAGTVEYVHGDDDEDDGTSGQDRESYSDDQDRESYTVSD